MFLNGTLAWLSFATHGTFSGLRTCDTMLTLMAGLCNKGSMQWVTYMLI